MCIYIHTIGRSQNEVWETCFFNDGKANPTGCHELHGVVLWPSCRKVLDQFPRLRSGIMLAQDGDKSQTTRQLLYQPIWGFP